MTRGLAVVAVTLALLSPLGRAAAAEAEEQAPAKAAEQAPAKVEEPAPAEAKPRETSFAVVPGPFINPSLGVGLNVMPLLMFYPDKKDTVSPPSMAVMSVLYAAKPPLDGAADRQSLFMNSAMRLFLDEDRWRVVVMAAYFNLYQQFFGLGGDVSSDALFTYRVEQVMAIAQVFREVGWKGFYLGAMVGYSTMHTKTDDPANQEILDALGSGAAWRGQPIVGVLAQYDSRDNKYYPTTGSNLQVRVNGSFQSSQEYLVVAPGFNQYFPLGDRGELVLAYRLFAQLGYGELPISAYAHYGMRGTPLGYESGEYLDEKMAGGEAEVRWTPWRRFGIEGGAGAGKVFKDFSEFGDQPWLPGVWGSGTYKVMEKQDMRARATLGLGKSGLLFYFTLGQNF